MAELSTYEAYEYYTLKRKDLLKKIHELVQNVVAKEDGIPGGSVRSIRNFSEQLQRLSQEYARVESSANYYNHLHQEESSALAARAAELQAQTDAAA